MRRISSRTRQFTSRGFSLIELLVSIAIIALISTVVLMQYGSFNSVILLKSLAYEIALTVREAQTFGVSVRSDGGTFQSAYGVHFDKSLIKSYTLFIDRNANNRYDTGEDVTTYQIGQGNQIFDLCVNTICDRDTLDIVFRRPEPDAIFTASPVVANPSSARIIVGYPDVVQTRTVRVWSTGQIAVE